MTTQQKSEPWAPNGAGANNDVLARGGMAEQLQSDLQATEIHFMPVALIAIFHAAEIVKGLDQLTQAGQTANASDTWPINSNIENRKKYATPINFFELQSDYDQNTDGMSKSDGMSIDK